MESFKQFFDNFSRPKAWLILADIIFVFFLILLSNLKILPFKNIGDFIFFIFIGLAFALYRPGWAFLMFIGTIALENINLAPESVGMAMRPYQIFGALAMLAVAIRWIFRRLNFQLVKLKWYDSLPAIVAMAGFLSALGASDKGESLRLSIVVFSFATLYFLARIFLNSIGDLKRILPFFIGSGLVVVFYGIWQNIRSAHGLNPFETMLGRPNGTFPEADWLGTYLIVLVSVIYTVIFYVRNKAVGADKKFKITNQNLKIIFLYFLLVTCYMLLILTVSRSAWLGAFAAAIIFLFTILTNLRNNPRSWQWKSFGTSLLKMVVSGAIAVAAVYFFQLTDFQLLNRAQSAGTGLQKITIACIFDAAVPEKIEDISELEKFGCRHINLEEIGTEKAKGNLIAEIYRDDPNVRIRKEIYEKSWEQISKHPMLGIGWGSIGKILGTDSRGSSLNASNIFLEVWLGTGIIGIVAFVILWMYVFFRSVKNFVKATVLEERLFSMFMLSAWLGLSVFNLFNSGILLGFLWLFLAASFIDLEQNDNWN